MLPIKGLTKTSLIDYPPYTSCVVFIGGCNLKCPFCHNADMVDTGKLPDMSEDEIFGFLEDRKKWLDAVVITGGEPTLYKELIPFIESIKAMGFKVKLDTNGTNPGILEKLIPMLDSVAMDIKSDKDNYAKAASSKVDMDSIEKSIELVKKAKDYEFRTTVIPQFYNPDIAKNIGEWLKGSKKYAIQQYRPDTTLDKDFSKEGYCNQSIRDFGKIMEKYFEKVELRGV